jgi:TP901 family phage tail tape measure protein
MAENNNFEAKHIASLDFDVSKIHKQFADLNKETEKNAKEIKRKWNGVLTDKSGESVLKLPEMSYKSVDEAVKSLQELLAQKGKVSQFKYGFDEMGQAFKATATVIDGSGNKIVETYRLIDKNVGEAVEGTQEYEKVWQSAGGTITQNFNEVGKAAEKTGESFDKARKKGESFFQKVIDKVYWTAAFRITNTLFRIPGQIYEVIKDTEYAVVEITRILNEAQLDTHKYTQDIYNTAIAYGATFEDAVSITKRFAQAGYDSAESLGLMKQALVALNTAELDANQATSGLIAIMKQLGWSEEYALNNLDLLIDKVNITADNFAVDSATIIEALQKVAGTARAAGQDLDDMIGIITVLSEATGASGANIGNAYKSIISYIQRASSLNTFENLGIDVYADRAKGTLLPINKILDNLASSWQKWDETARTSFIGANSELVDTLNELNDASGEYQTTLESLNETAEIGSTIEERNAAQAAAGMHRRNYFIALMDNYNRVQEVTNNLIDAEGYSMEENAKTMETLEKKVTALKTSIKALLYEAGRAGALEIVKGITDILTGIVRLTQDIGGLNTVLLAVLSIVTLIKAQAIGTAIATLATRISKLAGNIKAFIQLAVEAKSVSAALSTTFVGGQAAASSLSVAVSGLGVALIGLTSVIAIANAIEAKRQQQIADGIAQSREYINSVNSTKDAIKDLFEQYKELYNTTGGTFDDTQLNTVKGIQEQINDLLGDQAEKVDLINAKLSDQEQIYKNISLEAAKAARQGLSDAVNKAGKALIDSYDVSLFEGVPRFFRAFFRDAGAESEYQRYREIATPEGVDTSKPEEVYKIYQNLIKEQKRLYDSFGENATQLSAQSTLYNLLGTEINRLREAAEAYAAVMKAQASTEAYIEYQEKLASGFSDTEVAVTDFYEDIKKKRGEWKEATDWERQAMMELLKETYPEYFNVVKKGSEDLIDTQTTYNKLVAETKASLSELTGAYQTIVGAIDEYNQNGTMSIETLDRLLSLEPQYIALLVDEGGQLELHAEAYENKFRAMVAVLQAQKLDEITEWIKGLTAEQLAIEGLSGAYKGLNEVMLEGKLAALGNALTEKVAAEILTVEHAMEIANAIKTYFDMFDNINFSADANVGVGGADDIVKEAERKIDWLKFYAEDSASEQLKIYEDLLAKQTDMDEKRLETVRKIAQLRIQIAKDEADAAIAAKKKEWAEIDRAEDYRKRKKELEDELAYWSVRGTSEAARKRSEITKQLVELESSKQTEDARATELAALEAKRDAQIAEIMAQYGQLEKDIIENMMTEDERSAISYGMKNLNNIDHMMVSVLRALYDIRDKLASKKSSSTAAPDVAAEVVKNVKRELERYYQER